MNQKFTIRLAGLASMLALLSSISANVSAQQPYYYQPVQPRPMTPYQAPVQPNTMRTAPMPSQAYNYPSRAPYNAPYRSPYGGPGPMNRPPAYASGPNGNRPMYGDPRFGGAPYRGYNRGSRGPIPFESNFTPWSTRFWEEMGDGGKDPFRDMGDWFDPREPREGMANFWDDIINAPHEAGKMPGGWTAPSVSVPNPVDVQKEFQETGKQVPDEVRKQADNIQFNTW